VVLFFYLISPQLLSGWGEVGADAQRISGEIERTWRVLVMQEGASKREIWKHKVEQVIEETDSLKLAIDRVHKRVRASAVPPHVCVP
jgi:predicted DNA-binding protein